MAWVVLVIPGVLERGRALSRTASEGFTGLWPPVSFLVLVVAGILRFNLAEGSA